MTLRTERIGTIEEMRAFVKGSEPVDFGFTDCTSAYAFIRRTLVRFEYHALKKPDKGTVGRFLEKATGFSEAQVDPSSHFRRRSFQIFRMDNLGCDTRFLLVSRVLWRGWKRTSLQQVLQRCYTLIPG